MARLLGAATSAVLGRGQRDEQGLSAVGKIYLSAEALRWALG